MLRLLFVVAVVGVLFAGLRYIRQQPPEEQKRLWPKALLWGTGVILLLMVLTGKLHWIGVIVAALLPLMNTAGRALLRFAPQLLSIWQKQKAQASKQQTHKEDSGDKQPPQKAAGEMSISEALEVLNLSPNPGKAEIIQAHRRMIQQFHPDRGGNDYFASKLNLAKSILLKHAAKE